MHFQQLCLVTLSLFWTLVDLNCEDLMLALVFQYLAPCTHVMLSQRSRLTQPPEPAQCASHKLLNLIPEVCQVSSPSTPLPHTLVPNLVMLDWLAVYAVITSDKVMVVVGLTADSSSSAPHV